MSGPTPLAPAERRRVSAYAVFGAGARPRPRVWWRRQLPALMLVGTLAVTLLASGLVYWSLRVTETAHFHNAVRSAADRVDRRIETYVALLSGGRALFAASRDVSAAEFHAYVERLELARRFPGVQGIGFSRRLSVPAARLDSAALAAAMREGGSPATHFWPAHPRDEYHAIVYLEPLDRRNRAALGFDMHTEPARRAAMDRARDRGMPAASAPVTLKQEIEGDVQQGFLVYLPVYEGGDTPPDVASRRRALRGFVYAPFRAGDLFAGIFGSEDPAVAFRVFDGPDTVSGALLFDSRLGERPPRTTRRRALTIVEPIDVAGRTWTLAFTPREGAGDSPGVAGTMALAVTVIAVLGVLVAGTLFHATRAEMRARDAAERSDALRGRFLAAMSHELRTPINAVLGYNDLLLAGVYGPLASAQEHGIARSQRAAHHLLELINDVLDLSKLEAGKMEIAVESVPLADFLDDLLVTIRPMAEERGCALRFERERCDCAVETDPRRLRQILMNLLSNATKFGAGRPVVVSCTLVPHGAPMPGPAGRGGRRRTAVDAVVIAVTDGGPGIAPVDHERIFEEFVQLPGATPGGTGLGLPISRRLAELLGGHLTLESTPGRGSTFSVAIPRHRPR